MEYFDVYDINRNKLNYTKIRGEELLPSEYNVGVEIWIFNNHKLLMTKRSINKSHPLEWEVPGGCSIVNETSLDTLIRELKEELGIIITKNECKYLTTTIYKHQFVDIYTSNLEINLNKVNLQEVEVSDVAFFTKEEFLKLAKDNKIVNSVFDRYNLIKDKLNNY